MMPWPGTLLYSLGAAMTTAVLCQIIRDVLPRELPEAIAEPAPAA
jgi:hypothetical protein